MARPPVSQERLSVAQDGQRLVYSFKRAWRDGSYAVVLEPLDLLARLAALIPPPRFHMACRNSKRMNYGPYLAHVRCMGRGAGNASRGLGGNENSLTV
ncbi:transposase [Pseudenhygromyxa sp. WMMC2535]|nr:transposase [Pseudenhygromyxa sp. WMMC2535]